MQPYAIHLRCQCCSAAIRRILNDKAVICRNIQPFCRKQERIRFRLWMFYMISACNAIKIPKDLFLKWIEIDRAFSLYISIQISEKMYYTSINSRANVTYPLKSRLIFFLWNFLDEHNLDTVHKDILVEGVGSNIRSVNRIIKELVNEDLIEYNKGFIKVKNMDKLMDLIMSPNPNKPNFNNQN